ncbi:unnamed protein product [Nippostrongylus brasiliensis]|uniref:Acetyl-coenzyme A transporter 1 (inferred by orthology to a human protein) n=1 Tax=Nippostrongylus brasiliensis TaxID=27835 RepID=A0A0N4YY78_NIPBR|nr:unnamed protein product [Nippostrongylus brasiliensis]
MLIFLQLDFFAAIQDIAVDGWALTILSRKNVGYASTCNAVGQTAGYSLGNVVFLSLGYTDFANTFALPIIKSRTELLTERKEVDNLLESSPANGENDEKVLELGIVEMYSVLWKILKLKPMMYMLVILSTGKDRKVDGWTTSP